VGALEEGKWEELGLVLKSDIPTDTVLFKDAWFAKLNDKTTMNEFRSTLIVRCAYIKARDPPKRFMSSNLLWKG